ncbi:hypothetical protein GA0115255_121461, partial [Streptomyces sp. Ncost-T6T-2b]
SRPCHRQGAAEAHPQRGPARLDPAPGRTGSLDRDALRRRLGSFHQAAKEGRRDVEAEIAETGGIAVAGPGGVPTGRTGHESTTAHVTSAAQDTRNEETGDTVEEARS